MSAARPRREATELLQTSGGYGKLTTRVTTYIDAVTRPALEKADLRPLRRDSYAAALKMLLGKCSTCSRRRNRYRYGLEEYTIGAGMRPTALHNLLVEIGEQHGRAKMRTCRTVLNQGHPQQPCGALERTPTPGD